MNITLKQANIFRYHNLIYSIYKASNTLHVFKIYSIQMTLDFPQFPETHKKECLDSAEIKTTSRIYTSVDLKEHSSNVHNILKIVHEFLIT